jgi:hypothetical protein
LKLAMGDPSIYADKNKFEQRENDYKSIQLQFNTLNQEYETAFSKKLMELEGNL